MVRSNRNSLGTVHANIPDVIYCSTMSFFLKQTRFFNKVEMNIIGRNQPCVLRLRQLSEKLYFVSFFLINITQSCSRHLKN